jgi:hypothetical protein
LLTAACGFVTAVARGVVVARTTLEAAKEMPSVASSSPVSKRKVTMLLILFRAI